MMPQNRMTKYQTAITTVLRQTLMDAALGSMVWGILGAAKTVRVVVEGGGSVPHSSRWDCDEWGTRKVGRRMGGVPWWWPALAELGRGTQICGG